MEERVAEVKAKREKAKKKLDQYDEQIKRMEKQASDEVRRQRTHALIVCGAELAALFGKVLNTDEIHTVVNFLREQRDLGTFALVPKETKEENGAQRTAQEKEEIDENFLNELFGI